MRLSTIPISMLFAYAVATVCNYFEDTTDVNLIAVRCIAVIIAIGIICIGLPANNGCTTEEGAY